jgi:hypothetical protein
MQPGGKPRDKALHREPDVFFVLLPVALKPGPVVVFLQPPEEIQTRLRKSREGRIQNVVEM